MENNDMNILVNLSDVYNFIHSDDFNNYIMKTTSDISIGLFIIYVLDQTINYMMTDENLQT